MDPLEADWDDWDFGTFPVHYHLQADGTRIPMERGHERMLDERDEDPIDGDEQ